MKLQRTICFAGLGLLLLFAVARLSSDWVRLIYPVNDLTPVWVAAKAFTQGQDPYTYTSGFEGIWSTVGIASAEGCSNYNCILHTYPMGYPPTSLPLISCFSLVNYRYAVVGYFWGSALLFLAALMVLAGRLKLTWTQPRKLFLVGFGLALAPLHAGIHHSNLNTVVLATLIAGVVLMEDHPHLSGIALAFGLCIKPQVAFLFFIYPLLRKRWKAAFTGFAVFGIIAATGLLWMSFHHVPIYKNYVASLAEFMPPGGMNSFYMASPRKYTMINLQVLIYQFTHSVFGSHVIAWTIFSVLTAAAFFRVHLQGSETDDATNIALIAVLTLLPVYQQIYTAAILILVVYWALENWQSRTAKAAMILLTPLLLPLAAMTWEYAPLAQFVELHQLSQRVFWRAFIMPHVIWIEIILAVMLLRFLYRKRPPTETLSLPLQTQVSY